jgi:hypothetical protein
MNYQERPLKCCECGATFLFPVGKQQFYAVQGFTNEPERCPQCRAAGKARRNIEGDSTYRSPVLQR